jgi:uncharacterized membrane protein YhhN
MVSFIEYLKMKKYFFYLFFFFLAADLAANFFDRSSLRYFTKPFIIISLLGYFIVSTRQISSALRNYIRGALIFSWLGDVLLMFDSKSSLFFITGLTAFLIAHIFYIYSFNKIRTKEAVKGNFLLLLPAVVYYSSLIYLLNPHLGDMKLPVIAYGFIITAMLLAALHLLFIKNKKAGQLIAAGAILFVVSDSLLAINKFYAPFENAGITIMLSYGLAQWLIVSGAVSYLSADAVLKNSGR